MPETKFLSRYLVDKQTISRKNQVSLRQPQQNLLFNYLMNINKDNKFFTNCKDSLTFNAVWLTAVPLKGVRLPFMRVVRPNAVTPRSEVSLGLLTNSTAGADLSMKLICFLSLITSSRKV